MVQVTSNDMKDTCPAGAAPAEGVLCALRSAHCAPARPRWGGRRSPGSLAGHYTRRVHGRARAGVAALCSPEHCL